jgi:ATP-dependent Lon protease
LRREFALYRAVPIFNKRINVNPLKIDSKYIYKNFHTYVNKKNEEKNDVSYLPGKVNILAINGNKGVVRTFEVNVVKGQGKVIFAGNVEQAMKESINNAIGFIRGNTQELGLEQFVFDSTDIQINIPQTFSKNDGPSAGIAIVTAILSAINGIPISKKIVMTGEISLKGDVYSVGAIYEKLYASIGAGANIAFISVKNDKEIKEMISSYRRRLRPIKIIAVNNYFQIFKELFSKSTSEQQKQTNTKDQIEDKNVGK